MTTTTRTVRYVGPFTSIDVDDHPKSIARAVNVEVAEPIAVALAGPASEPNPDWEPVGWERDQPDVPEHLAAVPAGSRDEVLAWVGDDPIRAQAALAAERARAKPRTTLTNPLEQLLDDTTTKEP